MLLKLVPVLIIVATLIITLCASKCCADESDIYRFDPKVTISTGTLVGRWKKSVEGKAYRSFLRVPYAMPPTGSLRFRPPEPPMPWDGERNAKLEAPPCPQYESFVLRKYIGREDCLFLNVYAPKPSDKLAPVFVFIPGGAFRTGASASFYYNPIHVMNSDTVVVTLNYRLNVFGFLTTRHETAPGNLGIRDVLAALRWVQNEIRAFGGDPSRVTVSGQSAGGVIATSLLYSKEATGLFSQMITFSGTALCPWAWQSTPAARGSEDLIRIVGCSREGPEKTLECLQKVRVLTLQKASQELPRKSYMMPMYWAPRVDDELPTPLFPGRINRDSEIINKVPLMIGFAKEDGLMHPMSSLLSAKNLRRLNDSKTWGEDCPAYFFLDTMASNQAEKVCESIRREYFGPSEEIDEDNGFDLIEALKDRMFGVCSVDLAEQMTKSAPVFAYSFNYVPHNFSTVDFADTFKKYEDRALLQYRGATHSSDLLTLFRVLVADGLASAEFGKRANDVLRSSFISRIVNFVHNGNPNRSPDDRLAFPKWPPFEPTVGRHFVFDIFPRISHHLVSDRRLDFWHASERNLET